ncbi:hypothetical protein FSARC_5034 [Fusarium sarcochroum]|uniref:Uncharacterized protein n=1 Tax=Fusarium sarcochroum TaxID=1208366 RepID=A0A8H4U0C7_9HYPO|nr:hypothetical protein FSARC_5034 [Fusarium sarcochroum]
MSKKARPDKFPGFTALSDRIFIRKGEESADAKPTAGHPRVIIIYGWGDALPKHILKFADGYRQLYPQAKQIAVLAPISKGFLDHVSKRSEEMHPVIHEAFPEGTPDASHNSVLCHVMSNSGCGNYAATLNAYKDLYNRPFPHQLTVWDSGPGDPTFTWENLKCWSNAMAIGTASWFPWPFFVTRCIWGLFLSAIHFHDYVAGREPTPIFSKRVCFDDSFQTKQSLRLFLYGKEDVMIPWQQIEQNVADMRECGFESDAVVFKGSGHVGHMRNDPEKYWASIGEAWAKAARIS